MSKDDEPLKGLASGFRKRTLVTAKLATRMGVAAMKRQIGLGKDEPVVDSEKATQAAMALVKEMGALKGLVMKFGQIASYMPGALPPEAQRVLARLQSQSTALEWPAVAEVLKSELGEEPDALFTSIEREPFAAASIGQVHRAQHEGRTVAVKIQYPGIEDALESDLETLRLLAKMGTLGTAVDADEVVDELGARSREECDYLGEADNQRLFARLWRDERDYHVPTVVEGRTSRRVLTTELCSGRGFLPFVDEASQADKDRAGTTIFRACFDSLFRHGIFNGDPHPGNYLFRDDGRVTFLDFGCIRRFEPAWIENWKAVARSVLDDDKKRFREVMPLLGFVPDPKRFDWESQWANMEYLYLPFKSKKPFQYTHDYVRKSYGVLVFDNPNQTKTAMPAEWVYLNRLQWGLNSVLSHLGATGPWGEIWRAAVESKTTIVHGIADVEARGL